MPLLEEKELEGLKREMESLAEHLEDMGDTLDGDEVSGMLRMLLKGHTAKHVAAQYELDIPGV